MSHLISAFIVVCTLILSNTSISSVNSTANSIANPSISQSQQVTSDEIPQGLSNSQWHSIQTQIQRGKYKAYANDKGLYQSSNPANGWQIDYARDGTTTLSSYGLSNDSAYQISLRLNSVSYDSPRANSSNGFDKPDSINFANDRLNYHWNENVTEYWINSEQKLEQWFEIKQRPSNYQKGKKHRRLQIQMTLDTNLEVSLKNNSLSIGTITYDQLKVWDANGQFITANLNLQSHHLTIVLDDTNATYPLTIDPSFTQQAYLKASNASELFGGSISISGDTLVVGAKGESSNATGVNGDQADFSAPFSGAAYVFVRLGNAWIQQAYLKASNTDTGDRFGSTVSISGDTLVVGAKEEDSNATGVNGSQSDNSMPGSGAAYVFVRNGTTWSQQSYLKASNTQATALDPDLFGGSVSVSGDTLVVGAIGEDSNAMGVDGDQSNNSMSGSGAAYVFVRSGTIWSQQAYLKASNTGLQDSFGRSVSIFADTLVIGAENESSNTTGVNGDQGNNSTPGAGAAYVFIRTGITWSQQAYLKASNTGPPDTFGGSVSISGDSVVVGAIGEDSNATGVDGNQIDNSRSDSGAVYVFVRTSNTWAQEAYIKASNSGTNDHFGISVSVSGDSLVVGANSEQSNTTGIDGDQTNNTANASGAAYVFFRNGTTWSQQTYLKASNTDIGDMFGSSVSISGSTLVVGAPGEASNANDVNGNQSDNSDPTSGAAYVFDLTYRIGGTVSGLASGNSVALKNNGGEFSSFSSNGTFTFPKTLNNDSTYEVTVFIQPNTPDKICAISNDSSSGTIMGADITDVLVICSDPYTIGGNVTGLVTGNNVILQNNGGNDLLLSGNGPFSFATAFGDGSDYIVTVLAQPGTPNQFCSIVNESGTLDGADVINMSVSCNAEPSVMLDVNGTTEDTTLSAMDVDGTATSNPNDNSVLANDTDFESDNLFILAPGTYTAGGIGGSLTLNSDGTYNYIPPDDAFGNATLDYQVGDGISTVDVQLLINVLSVNDAPSFSIGGDIEEDLYDLMISPLKVVDFITAFDLGPDNESKQQISQYSVTIQSDSNGILNATSVNSAGVLSIDFTTNVGVALIDITLQDDGGTDFGGQDTSPVQSFFISFSNDIIFINGFEAPDEMFILTHLIQVQTETLSLDYPVYNAELDAISFNGQLFYLNGDYQSTSKLETFENWLKEVLIYKVPYGDYDSDGIENYLDSQPFKVP